MKHWCLTFLLLSLGNCAQLMTSSSATTEQQLLAQAAVVKYAQPLGIPVEVRFSDDVPWVETPYGKLPAAAWIGCPDEKPPYMVYFNETTAEQGTPGYLDGLAAHEVCHLYYQEYKYPCLADEVRAEECAWKLQTTGRP